MTPVGQSADGRSAIWPTRAAAPLVAALALLAGACGGDDAAGPGEPSGDLILASTTSTADTGLLDVLAPAFEAGSACDVKVVAVGSGQAIALGEREQADALLVHSPTAEEEFMAGENGVSREPVMANRFVLVGPPADPAGAKAAADAPAALAAIAGVEAAFASRSDLSGTHANELSLWEDAGVEPGGVWYVQTGQGMARTLRIASERRAYTLSDEATFLTTQNLDLQPVLEGDPALDNPYSVIVVAGERVNAGCAEAFAGYLTGAEGQDLIASFGVERFGRPLFRPTAAAMNTETAVPATAAR